MAARFIARVASVTRRNAPTVAASRPKRTQGAPEEGARSAKSAQAAAEGAVTAEAAEAGRASEHARVPLTAEAANPGAIAQDVRATDAGSAETGLEDANRFRAVESLRLRMADRDACLGVV